MQSHQGCQVVIRAGLDGVHPMLVEQCVPDPVGIAVARIDQRAHCLPAKVQVMRDVPQLVRRFEEKRVTGAVVKLRADQTRRMPPTRKSLQTVALFLFGQQLHQDAPAEVIGQYRRLGRVVEREMEVVARQVRHVDRVADAIRGGQHQRFEHGLAQRLAAAQRLHHRINPIPCYRIGNRQEARAGILHDHAFANQLGNRNEVDQPQEIQLQDDLFLPHDGKHTAQQLQTGSECGAFGAQFKRRQAGKVRVQRLVQRGARRGIQQRRPDLVLEGRLIVRNLRKREVERRLKAMIETVLDRAGQRRDLVFCQAALLEQLPGGVIIGVGADRAQQGLQQICVPERHGHTGRGGQIGLQRGSPLLVETELDGHPQRFAAPAPGRNR